MSTKLVVQKEVYNRPLSDNYEFNRFKSDSILNFIFAQRYKISGFTPKINLELVIGAYWSTLRAESYIKNKKIYSFFTSHYWKKDTRLNRYKGIENIYPINSSQLSLSGVINQDNAMLNWGIFEINELNFIAAFKLALKYECSIFFTSNVHFDRVQNNILNCISSKNTELSFHLNLPLVINEICSLGEVAILFNGWDETNDYFLDIFQALKPAGVHTPNEEGGIIDSV